jgi:hypothetical protein
VYLPAVQAAIPPAETGQEHVLQQGVRRRVCGQFSTQTAEAPCAHIGSTLGLSCVEGDETPSKLNEMISETINERNQTMMTATTLPKALLFFFLSVALLLAALSVAEAQELRPIMLIADATTASTVAAEQTVVPAFRSGAPILVTVEVTQEQIDDQGVTKMQWALDASTTWNTVATGVRAGTANGISITAKGVGSHTIRVRLGNANNEYGPAATAEFAVLPAAITAPKVTITPPPTPVVLSPAKAIELLNAYAVVSEGRNLTGEEVATRALSLPAVTTRESVLTTLDVLACSLQR